MIVVYLSLLVCGYGELSLGCPMLLVGVSPDVSGTVDDVVRSAAVMIYGHGPAICPEVSAGCNKGGK